MIERQVARRVAGQEQGNITPCEWSLAVPTVFDYLTQRAYGDGSPRATSSVLLFNDAGIFKAMLKDSDAKLCCWVAADSLAGLFAALEAALCDPKHEWRADRSQAGDKARRVIR